jgi:predicted TIM-barrel fold metal-dependent hydrolase
MQTEAQRIFAKEHICVDTMGFSTEDVREAVRVFGSERVVFGTDYGAVPISPTEHLEIVQSIELPKDDEERESFGATQTNSSVSLSMVERARRRASN